MLRRIFYTVLFLALGGCAFYSADPQPDVNLFGVMFLFFAFVVWFYWDDIQAGYACFDEVRAPRSVRSDLMLIRFAPMYLRELTRKRHPRA